MTTMTSPDIDLDALDAAVNAAIAELDDDPPPQPTPPPIRVAQRTTMQEARAHFDAGGDVLVSERGHEKTFPVTPTTIFYNNKKIGWDGLRKMVAEWRTRYPNQRYYIVPTPGVTTEPKPEPQWKAPSFAVPTVEVAPSLEEAIAEAVGKVLTGSQKTAVDKRNAIVALVAAAVAELPIYGIDLDYARLPIGDPIELGNANIEVDGYGHAATITVDGGTPIWAPQ
jgi:hypothetical protein